MSRRSRIVIAIIAVLASATGFALLTPRTVAQAAPPPPVVVTFSYDSLGRVVREVYPTNSTAYNYDAAGNRTTFTLN
ncbi:RHS repeat protein [Bradyrhizobium sp. CB1717]|uniref:RHS repeat domain-containing protein n=1 Tax=Bradyrhizobium sp. CB1717 TaxID=3039154 RepID=UPI0024B11153|nr:RHS repeat domain-containing protein [Bradyrhizobium sp. CB1717]WFU25381.1 RHS repeat protein [Bradyrhizobium sp. CB1717]